jgi:hypothetical protein
LFRRPKINNCCFFSNQRSQDIRFQKGRSNHYISSSSGFLSELLRVNHFPLVQWTSCYANVRNALTIGQLFLRFSQLARGAWEAWIWIEHIASRGNYRVNYDWPKGWYTLGIWGLSRIYFAVDHDKCYEFPDYR